MPPAPLHRDEQARLNSLRRYAILDTPPEEAFGRIVSLTARLFGVPIAVITFIDECRQWNKVCGGFEGIAFSRDASFCAYTILQKDVLVVPDTLEDDRFSHYASVTAEPHVRFYAGAPLRTPEGYPLGALCIVDSSPRPPLTTAQRQNLTDLARLVMGELELRLALENTERLQLEQKANQAYVESIYEATRIGLCSVDEDGRYVMANQAYCHMYGLSQAEIIGQSFTQIVSTPESKRAALKLHRDFLVHDAPYPKEWRVRRKDGGEFDIWVTASKVTQPDGKLYRVSTVTDLSEIRALEQERAYLADLVDQVSDAVISTGLDFMVQSWSKGAERLYGYTAEETLGRHVDQFISTNFLDEDVQQARHKLFSQGRWSGELEQRGKAAHVTPVLSSVTLVRDATGQLTGTVAVNRDLSEAKSLLKQLHHQAHHDSLTGLPNRRLMRDRLEQACVHARRSGNAIAFFLLDVDNFKLINDFYGHISGDHLLEAVGQRLRGCLRESDTVSRWGGDEFAVLACDLHQGEDAGRVAESILAQFLEPFEVDGHDLHITLSIGIATYPDHIKGENDPFRNADVALYRAKGEGKNTYSFFMQDLHDRFVGRHLKERAIRQAIKKRDFVLYYQPRVDLRSGEIESVEALVRWPQGDGTLISPDAFIPLAEESSLIVPLGTLTLEMAMAQAARWREQGHPRRVAVNLSAEQLRHPALLATINEMLTRYKLPARWLELEVTESVFVSDTDQSISKLRALKDLGIYILVDDFGMGYSSLSYLKRLPLDSLKIDRSFVAGLDGTPSARQDMSIVWTIIGLARSLDLVVVAEGVETASQAHLLQRLDCQQAQGYFFYRPLPAQELAHQPVRRALQAGGA